MGMNVVGFPDIVMKRVDIEPDGDEFINIMHYMFDSAKQIKDGDVIADESGPRYKILEADPDKFLPDSVMYNPQGRLKFIKMSDFVERN